MAVSEGVVNVHNALLPLLSLSGRPAELVSALMAVHAALYTVTNLVQDSFEGQEAMRENTARSAAVTSLHLFHLTRQGSVREEGLAADTAALRLPILSAYDPRCEVAGRPPDKTRCCDCTLTSKSAIQADTGFDALLVAAHSRVCPDDWMLETPTAVRCPKRLDTGPGAIRLWLQVVSLHSDGAGLLSRNGDTAMQDSGRG